MISCHGYIKTLAQNQSNFKRFKLNALCCNLFQETGMMGKAFRKKKKQEYDHVYFTTFSNLIEFFCTIGLDFDKQKENNCICDLDKNCCMADLRQSHASCYTAICVQVQKYKIISFSRFSI